MHQEINEKPRLLDQGQGFSVLNVEYKSHLLYSRYDPKKSILKVIENTPVLSGTLVFLFSPVLFYGLEELKEKLPENSIICAVEADESLFSFTRKIMQSRPELKDIPLFSSLNLPELDAFIRNCCTTGKIRRPLSFAMSGGQALHKDFYAMVFNAAVEIISSWWKNRITLQGMARLYNRNIVRNLLTAADDGTLESAEGSIRKEIIVCGAGESLEKIQSLKDEINAGKYYVIAADAALKSLQNMGIRTDAVVMLESQNAVRDFFTGCSLKGITLISDLSARNEAALLFEKRLWFFTEFIQSHFLDEIKSLGLFSRIHEPMGSVGLSATAAALILRSSPKVNVYVFGLDFSYSAGKTHSNYSLQHERLLHKTGRTAGLGNYEACFSPVSFKVEGGNESPMFTTKTLSLYAKMFRDFFSGKENLYSASDSGMFLNLPCRFPSKPEENTEVPVFPSVQESRKDDVLSFMKRQEEEINKAVSLMENGPASPYFNQEFSLSEQLEKLLEEKDYLYIHFPDGMNFSMEESFLKRIKAELLFFRKQFQLALKNSR